MSKRLLEKCPHCNHDLGVALNRYLFQSLPGSNFEFECPNCQNTVEVEVESQPIFWVSPVAAQQRLQADVAYCHCDHPFLQTETGACGNCLGEFPPRN